MKKTIYALIPAILILSGCSHSYYAPNTPNAPLLREKNDMRISAAYSAGDEFEGAELQFAYAVTPNIGFMVNGLVGGQTDEDMFGGKQSGKGSYGEIGVGYFKPFTPEKLFVFEIYGGAGTGFTKHEYGNTTSTSKVGATKYFIQPSIGYMAKKGRFDLAISSRFSGVNLKVKDEMNIPHQDGEEYSSGLDYVRDHPFSMMWEPSIRIGMGSKDVKFSFSLTRSINLSNSLLQQEEFNASFGMRLTLNAGKKK